MKKYEMVPSGLSETLICSVDGKPRPVVEWYKDNQKFEARQNGEKVRFTLF